MEPRPRILLLGTAPPVLAPCLEQAEYIAAESASAVGDQLAGGPFAAVVLDAAAAKELFLAKRRDEIVLEHIDKGVAVLDGESRVVWLNPAMRRFCSPADPIGLSLMEALGATTLVADVAEPLAVARRGTPVSFRVYRPNAATGPYLDVAVQPVTTPQGRIEQQIAIVRNVTPEVEQQRKLDALHQAGRELADLDPSSLAEMNLPTRVELLKQNLRRYIHDLLHYDIIEVRLLDRRTGELQPLLEDGMTDEAARRVLFARDAGNGVTGYVAASGQSYLCMDTDADPLYIEGATGARSSMTVPLKYHDEVVGTLNVESPHSRRFGPDDLQFTELFSKEIASALHTLDLLSAQQTCTATQSLDLINREIAIPMDDVLSNAAMLLDRFAETDPAAAEQLRRVIDGARAVKQSIRKVERDLQGDYDALTARTMPLKGKRILVVDAEERLRKSAHLMMGQLGAEVETVGTALEAVSLARAIPFDAVLMDIKPPDLGGYETYRRLKLARPHARISMMTGFGYDSAHAIVKARAEGMQYVLFKPFRQDQVLKAILDPGPTPEPAIVAGTPA